MQIQLRCNCYDITAQSCWKRFMMLWHCNNIVNTLCCIVNTIYIQSICNITTLQWDISASFCNLSVLGCSLTFLGHSRHNNKIIDNKIQNKIGINKKLYAYLDRIFLRISHESHAVNISARRSGLISPSCSISAFSLVKNAAFTY